MNARKRALLKYGSYGAGAMLCATLAALGSFKVSPLLLGAVHRAFLILVAIAMGLQALALSRRKKQDCFIVRREELIGGSFILLIGAALLLALALAGCSPDRAKRGGGQMNFHGSESTATWTLFGADGPCRLAAQDLPRKTQRIKPGRRPADAILRARGAGIAICAGSNRAGECFAGRKEPSPRAGDTLKD